MGQETQNWAFIHSLFPHCIPLWQGGEDRNIACSLWHQEAHKKAQVNETSHELWHWQPIVYQWLPGSVLGGMKLTILVLSYKCCLRSEQGMLTGNTIQKEAVPNQWWGWEKGTGETLHEHQCSRPHIWNKKQSLLILATTVIALGDVLVKCEPRWNLHTETPESNTTEVLWDLWICRSQLHLQSFGKLWFFTELPKQYPSTRGLKLNF